MKPLAMVGKSFISSSGFRLAASAARPVVSTADVRRKLRRLMPASDGAGFGLDWVRKRTCQ